MPGLLQTKLQRPPHDGNLMQQRDMRNHAQYSHPGGIDNPFAAAADIVGADPNIMKTLGVGAQRDGSQFFMDAAAELMLTDPALSDDIKGRARALDLQSRQMMKLMQIGSAMGEDMSSLGPIAEQLQKARQKAFQELIGRANVPTSATKPKVNIGAPGMKK